MVFFNVDASYSDKLSNFNIKSLLSIRIIRDPKDRIFTQESKPLQISFREVKILASSAPESLIQQPSV